MPLWEVPSITEGKTRWAWLRLALVLSMRPVTGQSQSLTGTRAVTYAECLVGTGAWLLECSWVSVSTVWSWRANEP